MVRKYVIKNKYADRIKLARKNADFTQQEVADKLNVSYQAVSSWEQPTGYVPDTKHLVEFAKLCGVSVSSLVEEESEYEFKTDKEFYKWDNQRKRIQTVAVTNKLKNTLKALPYAIEAHEGALRKNSDIPYITHLLNMACHLLAMDIKDDYILAATLLHDVIEDCCVVDDKVMPICVAEDKELNYRKVEASDLPVDKNVAKIVMLLTKPEGCKSREEMCKKYYAGLRTNYKAALIKLVDRCNNLTTMSWGLSHERVYRFIYETEKYVLPLLELIKNTEYDNAKWLLSYQIKTTLDIYKRLM